VALFLAWGGVALLALSAQAQTIRVYSEFLRIDPFGKIVVADASTNLVARPREILSPAVVRNAFASFHVVVTAPAGAQFTLYEAQNPEGTFQTSVYKEVFARIGGAWIPDTLEPVTLPYTTTIPDASQNIPGQTTMVFWLDVWVPHNAKVSRIKLEPQVWVDGRWTRYPMEVRVLGAIVANPGAPSTPLGGLQLSSDTTVRDALRCNLCGCEPRTSVAPHSLRRMILRNVLQDLALARSIEESQGKGGASTLMLDCLGVRDVRAWCELPKFPSEPGAEWYLTVRDALYRAASW